MHISTIRHGSYYRSASSELVEIEDALNAEHVVDPARGMQFCARANDVDDASNPHNSDLFMAVVLLLA